MSKYTLNNNQQIYSWKMNLREIPKVIIIWCRLTQIAQVRYRWHWRMNSWMLNTGVTYQMSAVSSMIAIPKCCLKYITYLRLVYITQTCISRSAENLNHLIGYMKANAPTPVYKSWSMRRNEWQTLKILSNLRNNLMLTRTQWLRLLILH